MNHATLQALQRRQLLLSVRLVNATHEDPPALTAPERFDALELAYTFGLWRARGFNRARELLSRVETRKEA